jgi:SynChlorMet cassette protein ScmC
VTSTLRAELEHTGLAFADGTVWSVEADDDVARQIVSRAAAAMQFTTHHGPARRLLVRTADGGAEMTTSDTGDVVCTLDRPSCEEEMGVQLMRLAAFLGTQIRANGALLLHGALAGRSGQGVILAGPGAVGKTTASRRLRPPWRSLSDDACLVVHDARDRYWAHPWPTWSEFFRGGGGGSWSVQEAIPLAAVFFLRQAAADRAGPMGAGEATCLLIEGAEQITPPKLWRCTEQAVRAFRLHGLRNACALARKVTTCQLDFTMDGAFWREMERHLPPAGAPEAEAGIPVRLREATERRPAKPFNAFYSGPSMNPTLRQGDLMEVLPCGDRSVRAGDVLFIVPPGSSRHVVHRAVSVTSEGIRTRGDNCCQMDPWTLRSSNIAGRVVAAWRGRKRRSIAGARCGEWLARWRRAWRRVWRPVTRRLHPIYRALELSGVWRRLLPGDLRPRVIVFGSGKQRHARLMMGQRIIGHLDQATGSWRIHRPFRLFVNQANLPGKAEITGNRA